MNRASHGGTLLPLLASLCIAAFLQSASGVERVSRGDDASARAGRWKEAARKAGLGEGDIAALDKDGILITHESFKQVFEPYVDSPFFLFITSDSLLSAYHVLYEESILRLERARARLLPQVLRHLWTNLSLLDTTPGRKQDLARTANLRARAIIAIALQLTGQDMKLDPELAALVNAEVNKITTAEGRGKPDWLGPSDRGFVALDYSRYKPRGFYTRSEELERYFRALSWLQSIPLRLRKDDEFVTLLILAHSLEPPYEKGAEPKPEYLAFFETFTRFVGPGDDWSLLRAAGVKIDLAGDYSEIEELISALDQYRSSLTEHRGISGPWINDLLAFWPEDPSAVAEANFRIITPLRTPEAVLFQRTTDPRDFDRAFPSGLDVAAALGSSYAASHFVGEPGERVLAAIEDCRDFFSGDSLYLKYFDCMRALLDEPEPDAPAFMRSSAWEIKSCQTVLAGWAQLRHTWALQAKDNALYAGGEIVPPGFAEPDPEFFARMRELVLETEGLLRDRGAFSLPEETPLGKVRAFSSLLRKKDIARRGKEALQSFSDEEKMSWDSVLDLTASYDMPKALMRDDRKYCAEVVRRLDLLAVRLERGETLDSATVIALRGVAQDIEPLWRRLADICSGLETLSQKQLRGVALTARDVQFVKAYGEQIAQIMFYAGNSYLTPRDDAPRVVDVFTNPNLGFCLEVGVGRPRALYVLYPWGEDRVLCRGAVMPYYEFRQPMDKRLTDAEWKAMLDTEQRPESPEWVRPILRQGPLTGSDLPQPPGGRSRQR